MDINNLSNIAKCLKECPYYFQSANANFTTIRNGAQLVGTLQKGTTLKTNTFVLFTGVCLFSSGRKSQETKRSASKKQAKEQAKSKGKILQNDGLLYDCKKFLLKSQLRYSQNVHR